MPNQDKYSLNVLSRIHDAVFAAFSYNLTQRQAQIILNKQSKILITNIVDSNADTLSIDQFIDSISTQITGMKYPKYGDDEAMRKRFHTKLNLKKEKYFEPIMRIKV